jgi:hypothetical protein
MQNGIHSYLLAAILRKHPVPRGDRRYRLLVAFSGLGLRAAARPFSRYDQRCSKTSIVAAAIRLAIGMPSKGCRREGTKVAESGLLQQEQIFSEPQWCRDQRPTDAASERAAQREARPSRLSLDVKNSYSKTRRNLAESAPQVGADTSDKGDSGDGDQ